MRSTHHRGDHFGHRHHHPHGRPFDGPPHGLHHGRGRRRAPRGDIRTAVLLLLDEQPMHGYQLMQAIGERTRGAWTPSPGAVYPTINQLEDEGLVTVTADAGRKLVTLTDTGRARLAEHREAWGDPFADYAGTQPGLDLRRLVAELVDAARQVGRAGSDRQREAAAGILADARRALYLVLAESGDGGEKDEENSDG